MPDVDDLDERTRSALHTTYFTVLRRLGTFN